VSQSSSMPTQIPVAPQNIVTATSTQTNWEVYTNHKYGFSFSYPDYLAASGSFQEYTDNGQACAKDYAYDGTSINDVEAASVGGLNIFVACEPLTDAYINQFGDGVYQTGPVDMSTTTIGAKIAHLDYFTTALDYTYKVLQVPIDDTHYLEIDYSYKPSANARQLSDQDWAALIASIKLPL
jgi:hypothetical protein